MLDPVVARYVEVVAAAVDDVLGEATVGVYVHGSTARNDLVLATSDIDVLAVSAEPLTTSEKHAMAERLSHAALPCPAGGGLEFGLVTCEAAAIPSKTPSFEFDLSTRAGRADRFTDGSTYGPSADYLLHFAECLDAAIIVRGPHPKGVFFPAPHDWLAEGFAQEVSWAREHASPENIVLTACRAWLFAEEGVQSSKSSAAKWARDRGADSVIIDAAVARRRGVRVALDQASAERFLVEVETSLASSQFPHSDGEGS